MRSPPNLGIWIIRTSGSSDLGLSYGASALKRHYYNLFDVTTRHIVQAYPNSWTAISVPLDNKTLPAAHYRVEARYLNNEISILAPVPPIYQGMSEYEAVEAEEEFYCEWRFYFIILTGEERRACLRTLAKDKCKVDRKEKWGRIKLLGRSKEKVVEERPAVEDDLKAVEERARLAALHGEEDMSRMKIWLGVEEEKSKLIKVKVEHGKNVARVKADSLKEAKKLEALKASHTVMIGHLQAEARVNLEEMEAERERLGCHLMFKGYYEEEVDAIKEDTYVEEGDDEEVVVGVADGFEGVSRQTTMGMTPSCQRARMRR
ncbi:hypothetical protein GIB67_015267 [Kingdonia uniflora]|uniref:Uncharacterized protein n=1 Tax=Kingdonia uniflora TaxID=39325 RepID=A0A7J7MSQ8_9MAGN|nr:hypothetical protein GIB67_015267 [Kingdonia uniflora]